MQHKKTSEFMTAFEQEVYQGLTDFPKHLSSKYFYDVRGDQLFQEIMNLPEYYLTKAEFDILQRHKKAICQYFMAQKEPFNLIELGAGDGTKTRLLLRQLLEVEASFQYLPIDISSNALNKLTQSLKTELPDLSINPVEGTYFESLEAICRLQNQKKVILFLGSNIGNLLHPQAVDFLVRVREVMQEEDLFFVGFDQKKDPQVILDAYNDPTGVTEAFNKNLLLRINKELDASFEPENFLHWETYDPETGTAKSYLISRKAHEVTLGRFGLTIPFKAWETIHTEISQKYDDDVVDWLAGKAGLTIVDSFEDPNQLFKDYLLRKG